MSPPEVIVLTRESWRANQIRQALQPFHARIMAVAGLEECRERLDASKRQLVVVDSSAQTGWRAVWDAARPTRTPMIVIIGEFDSREWVELFKAGVLDVMSDPVSPQRLRLVASAVLGRYADASENWAGRLIDHVRGWLVG